MIAFLKIFEPAVTQAIYDYLGWNTILGEPDYYKSTGWKKAGIIFFRIVKLTLDYPVTWYLCTRFFAYTQNDVAAFYIMKQCGLCDMIYIGIWKILHPGQDYTSEGIWWLWWTIPVGIYRTLYKVISPDSKAKKIYILKSGTNWWKGRMSFEEFAIQVTGGVVITLIFYLYAW